MLVRNDTDIRQDLPTLNVGAEPGETVEIPDDAPVPHGWVEVDVAPHPFAGPSKAAPITEVDPVAPSVEPHPFAPPLAADTAEPTATPQEG